MLFTGGTVLSTPARKTMLATINATHKLRRTAARCDFIVLSHTHTHTHTDWWRHATVWNTVSSTSCVCWCTATAPGYLSDLTVSVGIPQVVSYAQRQPPIRSYHQHVGHQLETVLSPLQVHERGTEQSTASPPLDLQIVLILQKRT